jgi:3-isopropylmalate/(R)-2-methylmalate dehydratase small subunit
MEPFTAHTGRAVCILRENIDTDQIVPARFCMRITKSGYADALFDQWRKDPDFVLNDPRREGASFLVAGASFGIGSSREHAVWALRDYGFKAVIAAGFGEIFQGNALKNAFLPVVLDGGIVAELAGRVDGDPELAVTVDLAALEVRIPGATWPFQLDPRARQMILDGADEINLTLRRAGGRLAGYEAGRPGWLPALRPSARALPTGVTADPA